MNMVQYTRETLYEEVWNEPVSTVAKKYGVSDVAIHKICKSMDIPVPPRGYWAKKRAGQKVQKTPLPKTDKRSTITRYFSIDRKPPKPEPKLMDILPEEEYKVIIPGRETRFLWPLRATLPPIESTFPPFRSACGSYFHLRIVGATGKKGVCPRGTGGRRENPSPWGAACRWGRSRMVPAPLPAD